MIDERIGLRVCVRLLTLAWLFPALPATADGGDSGESAATPAPLPRLEREIVFGRRPVQVARPAVEFSPELYLAHVYFLASDELKGRGVGTEGIGRAGQYIADQFASFGLEPAGDGGTYFQDFEVDDGVELSGDGYLALSGVEGDAPVVEKDYVPFGFSGEDPFEGEVVFVGYGLVNPEKDYDDYADADVQGKAVLMLRREPASWSSGRPGRLAAFENKMKEARSHGATAVLIVNQKPRADRTDRLMSLGRRGGRSGGETGLPAFHLARELGDRLLAAGGLESLDVLQERLDAETPTRCTAPLTGVTVRGLAGISRKKAPCRNVVGLVPGSGPDADEYVVIGAHYDHMGDSVPMSMFGRREEAQPQIHNGADDNASGTAGLIELARAFSAQSDLRRSVILVAFSAEEIGLLGSKHFVEHPPVPLDRIVACLNMDMIGRMKEDDPKVEIYGSGTGDVFSRLLADASSATGLTFTAEEAGTGRSDESSFQDANIPGIHFFSGLHPDYHQPSDDTDKINEQGAVRILQFVHAFAGGLIAGDSRPVFHDMGRVATFSRSGGDRAIMGIWPGSPDEDDASPGLRVEELVEGGPADNAGMKPDDRIVRIADKPIESMRDYLEAMTGKKAGDTLDVTVRRGETEVKLTVTLAAG